MPPLCESGSIFRACSWKGCTVTCNSCCETCIAMNKVCTECKEQGQSSHVPSLRACRRCLERNQQCLRAVVLVLATDFESGNKKAFELITESQANGDLNPQFIFICLPDAVHVGKSFKCNRANWMMLLHNERACLSVIRTIRVWSTSKENTCKRPCVKERQDGRRLCFTSLEGQCVITPRKHR